MKLRVQFKSDTGETHTAVFDEEAGTVINDRGETATFAFDLASNAISLKGDAFNGTISIEGEPDRTVGASKRYRVSDGQTGVATILALE